MCVRVRPCDHEAHSNVCSDNQGTCWEYQIQKALERQYMTCVCAVLAPLGLGALIHITIYALGHASTKSKEGHLWAKQL